MFKILKKYFYKKTMTQNLGEGDNYTCCPPFTGHTIGAMDVTTVNSRGFDIALVHSASFLKEEIKTVQVI